MQVSDLTVLACSWPHRVLAAFRMKCYCLGKQNRSVLSLIFSNLSVARLLQKRHFQR